MKYIILEKDGLEVAILFPEIIKHSEAINRALIGTGTFEVLSAGFCSVRAALDAPKFEISCWGESDSLRLKSRPRDASVIHFSLMLPSLQQSQEEHLSSHASEAA